MRNSNLAVKYPIRMRPAFKDYIWGGDSLVKEWGKASPYKLTAESWELAAHKSGQSIADNGPLEGKTLSEIVKIMGKVSLGSRSRNDDRFPILIKLIDPKQDLSIQVHPDDSFAREHEGENGKTEMWYIAEAKPEASILCGFKEQMTKEMLNEAILSDSLVEHMNRISVKKGDVFFISPGTVHAICKGLIIAEIQQNSNVTYRVYDYGRKGPDGKGRELHIEKAKQVADLSPSRFDGTGEGGKIETDHGSVRRLASCEYFNVSEFISAGKNPVKLESDETTFQSLLFVEGEGDISYLNGTESFKKGDTFFIPAGMGEYEIKGKSIFLLTER